MFYTLRSAWPLFFGLCMMMIGNGLQGTLLGIRASLEGFPTWMTGLVMSFYFLGFLCGSLSIPKILANVGHIRVFAALASLASSTVLLHGIFPDPMIWIPIRFVTGFSYAGLYIVVESWLNGSATNQNRGQIMAIYLLINYVGLSCGQFLLNLADPKDMELFVLTSVLVSLALVPISLSNRPAPEFKKPETVSIPGLFAASPLGIVSVFQSGFAMGIVFAITPVFAMSIGMTTHQISIFMAIMIIGGVLFQIPVGWLSDRMDRRILVIANSALAAVFCGLITFLVGGEGGPLAPLLLVILVMFGGVSMTIYGLAVAHTNDHTGQNRAVATSATLLLINGIGSCFGPVIATGIMDMFGNTFFFPFIGLTYVFIIVFGIVRVYMRAPVAREAKGDFVAMPARSSMVFPQIAETDGE